MTQKMRQSQLFIIRAWTEEREANRFALRGMVRNIQSGETRYFHQWEDLVAFVDTQLATYPENDFWPE